MGPTTRARAKRRVTLQDPETYTVTCTSRDGKAYSAVVQVTPAEMGVGTQAPAASAAATPGRALAGFEGFKVGDLVFDLGTATSKDTSYPAPVDGCWPIHYRAGDAPVFTVDAQGGFKGVCGSQVDPVGPGAESVRGGFLHGSLDPMTGAITFEYQAVSDFANDKGEHVGVTDRAVTFTGTGAMTSDDKAAGTATWVMECHGGTSVPCIEGWPVKVGSSMSVTGTIDRAMTFTR